MDKFKNVAKGGWHPSGDRQIHRDTWKSDLKGMATGKKNDPYAAAREHQSAPLSSLKDPDSFGPPPKHTGALGSASDVSTASSPTRGGLGAPVPQPAARPTASQRVQEEQEQEAPAPPIPYRTNTTGLRTDNLPKPPVRRGDAVQTSGSQSPAPSPMLPPRQPPRQSPQQTAPPPSLPPRQTEFPDEYTPAPPPTYTEATRTNAPNPAAINQEAASRLGQAGVAVPGFGIGPGSDTGSPQSPVRGPQLSELQARFARMNTGSQPTQPANGSPAATVASQKKAPPPPPPKKSNLSGTAVSQQGGSPAAPSTSADAAPPPVPFGSKPR